MTSSSDIPEIFRNPKSTVTFEGGPSDGDTIRLDNETYMVVVKDKEDESIKYTYLRVSADSLAYQGRADNKGTS